jgi:hypothetical protein
MKQSESITHLAEALAKAQGEIKSVSKDRTNPHFKNRYATLDAIMDAIRAPLAKQGLSIVQGASESTQGFNVETYLLHASGEYIANVVAVPVSKQDAQGVGSALTYGRRYGVSALLAIATDEDDDGNAATKKSEPKSEAKSEAKAKVDAKPERVGPENRPWDGTDHDARSFPFPVKGSKNFGKPMGDIDHADLRKFVEFAGVKPEYIHAVNRANAILGVS